ncbi:MAG: TnpV protein [Thomasclavelia sp.]
MKSEERTEQTSENSRSGSNYRRMEVLMEELLLNQPAPDKKTHQMEWVQHMNNLKAQAEEIILKEIIYN